MHPIRELRKRLGLTQAAFARAIDTHSAYVSQLECQHEKCGHQTALSIKSRYGADMAALDLDVEDLLRGSRARPAPTEQGVGQGDA